MDISLSDNPECSLINHTLGQWSLYNLELHSVPGSEVGTPPQRVLAAPNAIARPK